MAASSWRVPTDARAGATKMSTTAMIDYAVAVAVATMGLLWFVYVMKGLKAMPSSRRNLVYLAIWLAYFALTMVLTSRL